MTRIILISRFCLLVVLLKSVIVSAQTDCSINYEKAVLLFNSGMADSALIVIKPCVENPEALKNISDDTRARIFRLAALSSIMTGDPGEAEKYAKKMLTYQPDYKNTKHEEDLMEFQLMLDKISPQPSFILGITGGVNLPFIKLQKHYSNYELQSGEYTIDEKSGYQVSITGEKALSGNLSVEAAISIIQVNFNYAIAGSDISNGIFIENSYDQKITSLEVPVVARYYFKFKSFRPYLQGGITGRFLLNSMEKSDDFGRYWFTNASGSDKILTTFLTDFENFGILAGGGACYDFTKFSIRLDLRYNNYFNNSAKSSEFDDINGYEDIGSDEKFHYTDDINLIGMKCLQVSIGFLYNLSYKVF